MAMTDGGATAAAGERTGSARPWWLWYLGAVGALAVAVPFVDAERLRGLLLLASALGVLGAIAAGLRLHRPPYRGAWLVLLGAVAYTVVSTAAWQNDLFHFTTYPVLAYALARLPVQGRRQLRYAGYIEAGIITSAAAVLWWTLLVDPFLLDAAGYGSRPIEVALPMFDIAIFALGLRLLLIAGTRCLAYVLIAVQTGALLVADTLQFLSTALGPRALLVAAGCWLASNALLGAAALHPSMAYVPPLPDDDEVDFVGTARIYIVLVVATPIMTGIFLLHESAAGQVQPLDIPVPVGATALTAALVVARMRQLNIIARRRAVALEESLASRDKLQDELRRRAQHDDLTGLPNRGTLYDRVTAALARQTPGALLILDLDEFKEINDRFGHAVGDELLLAAADRLGEAVPDATVLARLDSDEFAVMVTADGPRVGERILSAMRSPFPVQGHELFATVSIGLRTLDEDLLTGDVLRDAYMALHAAKAAGRDQLTVFEPALSEAKLAAARTVDRLRGAVDRDELVVFYQPLVRLADQRMVGVEALVRWQPPGERMVPPDRFIPAAEDSGLIVPIGSWVLRRACDVVAGWHRRGHAAMVSVNVSPRQLREPDFAAHVLDAIRGSGLAPTSLILEITEGVLVDSGMVTDQAIRHLQTLRAHGIRVAVDDFGTGYSSLAYLRDLPIDHIKIDKSFLPAPGSVDAAPRTMVKAIIDLATGLGLGTIAEGVETGEHVALLQELGCERAQGYYFSRPVPESEAAGLLTAATWGSRV